MLLAAPPPPRTGRGLGRASPRLPTLTPPPPAGPSVLRPRRLRLFAGTSGIISALSGLCAALPHAPWQREGRGGNGRAVAGEVLFPRLGAANSADPFLWLVLGCGVVGGRSGEEPFGRARRAWKRWCHAPCQATGPRVSFGSGVNPLEERVASCRFHCPAIQTWGVGTVPFVLFPKGENYARLPNTGREDVGFVESLFFGVQQTAIYLFEERKLLEDTDSACASIAKVINIKLLDEDEDWTRKGLTTKLLCSREVKQQNCFFSLGG